MKKKLSLILDNEFIDYCELNNIDEPLKKAKETFKRGFTILKFGETPSAVKGNEVIREVEKEIIREVEVIREVEKPVEVIKEIEKIIEVEKPVEIIVEKEVIITDDEQVKQLGKKIADLEKQLEKKPKEIIKEVERVVEVTDQKEIDILKEENKKLKDELDKITSSLSNLNKAKYLKNSNLSSLYDE